MNRVWKKFLIKIVRVLAVVSYLLIVTVVPGLIFAYYGYDPRLGTLIGAAIFMFLPMIVILLRDLYKDAKQEVEWENRKLMLELGKKY